jgi:hypothetical protein
VLGGWEEGRVGGRRWSERASEGEALLALLLAGLRRRRPPPAGPYLAHRALYSKG